MAQVRWTPEAYDDLEAIFLFIARDSPEFAATFVDRIIRSTDRLASFPRSGRVVPEFDTENLRELLVGSYRIIYRIKDDYVHLLTIIHGARLLDDSVLKN